MKEFKLCYGCLNETAYAIESCWECEVPHTIYFCPVCKRVFNEYEGEKEKNLKNEKLIIKRLEELKKRLEESE